MPKTTEKQRKRNREEYAAIKASPVLWAHAQQRAREYYEKNKGKKNVRKPCPLDFEFDRKKYALASVNGEEKPILKPRQCECCRALFTPESENDYYCGVCA